MGYVSYDGINSMFPSSLGKFGASSGNVYVVEAPVR